MKRRNLFIAGIFSSILVGGLGCAGSGTDGSTDNAPNEDVGQAGWKITQISVPTFDGCAFTTLFDITAPQNIGFIAANASNVQAQDLQLHLFQLNQSNARQEVNIQAQQTASFRQTQHALAQASNAAHTAATSDRDHTDEATIDSSVRATMTSATTSSSQAAHRDQATLDQSASAAQRANANASAANEAAASQNTTVTGVDGALVPVAVDGLAALATLPSLPTLIQSVSSSASQRASQEASQAAEARNRAATSSSVTNERMDSVSSEQTAATDQQSQFHQAVANHTHDTADTSADQSASSSQEALQEIDQAIESSNLNNQQVENTLVFNTDQLQSQHFMLQVTSNQAASQLNVLAGAGATLGASVAFPITPISGCIVAVDPPGNSTSQ